MGWDFIPGMNQEEVIEDALRPFRSDEGMNITFSEPVVKGREAWAILYVDGVPDCIRLVLVDRERGIYGYKILDELSGPFFYSVPLSFFDLCPADTAHANKEWRAQVLRMRLQQLG